eukprot:TRINITY_DN513_c0_g2_i1.p1 TRINITY_DN513_c0_g2~~TRINITY_DN513_c0_g2_i1.p1  ORF type:complete len:173 (+),score=38.02 TRINITY_DN513_c0_g2_i1:30-521(+)
MHVHINILTGRGFDLQVELLDSVLDLKKKIQEAEDIPSKFQRLSFGNRELSDNNTLADYNIQHGSNIHMVTRVQGGPMRVHITTMIGKTITVEVERTDSVLDLKNKIQETEGIPSNLQRLIFDGKELNDDGLTLSDYDLKYGSKIELATKVIPGSPPNRCSLL